MRYGLSAVVAFVLVLAGCQGNASSEPVTIDVATATPTMAADPTNTPPPGSTPTTIPEPELVFSDTTVQQAGAILVSVTGNVRGGHVEFLDKQHHLSPGERSMYTFVGVGTEAPVGDHTLRAVVETANGSTGEIEETITVNATEWTVESLEFDDDTMADLLNPETIAAENALLDEMYGTLSEDKRWDGAWRTPSDGPVTARFGEQRSYNGSEPEGHHTGTDISANVGAPVAATANGRVVMARELDVRGNMVILDHGGGLLSGYAHLSAMNVSEGDEVEAGDIIAEVGNTGLSTGAHLHWEMAIHGTRVDPLFFVDGTNSF